MEIQYQVEITFITGTVYFYDNVSGIECYEDNIFIYEVGSHIENATIIKTTEISNIHIIKNYIY